MLERLRRDHDRIRELAALLAVEFDRLKPGDMGLLASLRWDMASTVMTHLAYEDRHLYVRFAADTRKNISDIGERFQKELRDAFTAYCKHARGWTPERIVDEWDAYRTAAQAFNSWLLMRAMREENELYPLVSTFADSDKPMSVTTNWARDTFDNRDSINNGLAA